MVENRITAMIQEMAMRLEQQGMSLEQYLQYAGLDMARIRDEYRETAEKNVRTDLMLEEVAKAEDIKVEGRDLESGSLRNGSVLWCDAEAGSEDHQGAGARQRSCSDGAAQEDGAVHRGQYHGVRKLLRGGTYELLCTMVVETSGRGGACL